jgi:hypothetical protein
MKFKAGDTIRVIENGLVGKIVGTSFNSMYQQQEYVVKWPGVPYEESYPIDECDSIWELEPCPVVNTLFTAAKAIIKINGTEVAYCNDIKVSVDAPKCNGYDHTWVECGFHFTKTVCKYCDFEKEKQ